MAWTRHLRARDWGQAKWATLKHVCFALHVLFRPSGGWKLGCAPSLPGTDEQQERMAWQFSCFSTESGLKVPIMLTICKAVGEGPFWRWDVACGEGGINLHTTTFVSPWDPRLLSHPLGVLDCAAHIMRIRKYRTRLQEEWQFEIFPFPNAPSLLQIAYSSFIFNSFQLSSLQKICLGNSCILTRREWSWCSTIALGLCCKSGLSWFESHFCYELTSWP